MTTLQARVSRAPGRGSDGRAGGSVAVPRWLRQHRRARRRAARPTTPVRDPAGRPAAAPGPSRPGPEPTLRAVLDAQGVRPFDPGAHRRAAQLSGDDWAELRAALAEVRAGE